MFNMEKHKKKHLIKTVSYREVFLKIKLASCLILFIFIPNKAETRSILCLEKELSKRAKISQK